LAYVAHPDNEDYVVEGNDLTTRPLLIAGPTASGKSALALAVAERDGGMIINADASQVYACWRVLTARPSEVDQARAPHRLYGHVPGGVRYSTGAWLRDVSCVLDECRARGLRPIVVGGTGLYFTALTQGFAEIPEISPEVRATSIAMLANGRLGAMLDDLARDDPETLARIDRKNPMRVQRAWEVVRSTGRGLAQWHEGSPAPLLEDAAKVTLQPDTSLLNRSIDIRLDAMVEAGALDECRDFAVMGLDPSLPSARVLGAPQFMAHLRGEMTLGHAIAESATATRQYAKRQRTWMRNRMADWLRVPAGPGALAAVIAASAR